MTPTAARWLVLDDEGDVRPVDVVGELLDLDPLPAQRRGLSLSEVLDEQRADER